MDESYLKISLLLNAKLSHDRVIYYISSIAYRTLWKFSKYFGCAQNRKLQKSVNAWHRRGYKVAFFAHNIPFQKYCARAHTHLCCNLNFVKRGYVFVVSLLCIVVRWKPLFTLEISTFPSTALSCKTAKADYRYAHNIKYRNFIKFCSRNIETHSRRFLQNESLRRGFKLRSCLLLLLLRLWV